MGTYADFEDVVDYLQSSTGLTSATVPSSETLERLISAVEDEIDDATGHAWRIRRRKDEYQRMGRVDARVVGHFARMVELRHWAIRTLDTAKGDKLEVWDGSSWVDWVASGSGKTEGRGDDYFLQARQGLIYFIKGFPGISYADGVRITYRYGEVDIRATVHQLAVEMTAVKVMRTSHNLVVAQGGVSPAEGQPVSTTTAQLDEEHRRKLADPRWLQSPKRSGVTSPGRIGRGRWGFKWGR